MNLCCAYYDPLIGGCMFVEFIEICGLGDHVVHSRVEMAWKIC